jgi:transcriptional regulator with XRE-family HTH domain
MVQTADLVRQALRARLAQQLSWSPFLWKAPGSSQRIELVRRAYEAQEVPGLEELAQALDVLGDSWFNLEVSCFEIRSGRQAERFGAPTRLAASTVIERLDLGHRLLRAREGVSRPVLARTAGVESSVVTNLENRKGLPSLDELDRLLSAMRASYAQLEAAIRDPVRSLRAIPRDSEHAPRVAIRGELLPADVNDRLDLAIQALRRERGWAQARLAKEASLPKSRIFQLESRSGRPPTEEEVGLIARALGASTADLVDAARNPVRGFANLSLRCLHLEARLARAKEELKALRLETELTPERAAQGTAQAGTCSPQGSGHAADGGAPSAEAPRSWRHRQLSAAAGEAASAIDRFYRELEHRSGAAESDEISPRGS